MGDSDSMWRLNDELLYKHWKQSCWNWNWKFKNVMSSSENVLLLLLLTTGIAIMFKGLCSTECIVIEWLISVESGLSEVEWGAVEQGLILHTSRRLVSRWVTKVQRSAVINPFWGEPCFLHSRDIKKPLEVRILSATITSICSTKKNSTLCFAGYVFYQQMETEWRMAWFVWARIKTTIDYWCVRQQLLWRLRYRASR